MSHRYAMLAAAAEGRSRIRNYATGADCASTLNCLESLGVPVERKAGRVAIEGVGLNGFHECATALDAGNSGSTIRMLSGILAGQPFETTIGGDESLSRRPMRRIVAPLMQMGARIEARDGQYPPLHIRGGDLHPIRYELPVASAQVKTCVLFAGLFAKGITTVVEPVHTRDHSEIALRHFGADIAVKELEVAVRGPARLRGQELQVPSDLSSAAFFIAAALILPGSELLLEGVGINPTRKAMLDVLRGMGADIEVRAGERATGEAVGDLMVVGPPGREPLLEGGLVRGEITAGVIDEIPVLAVLGAVSQQGIEIRDAAELRVKETDRIATVVDNLRRMGVEVEVFDDGMKVPGRQRLRAAELDSFGDHRIAMAFSVAALAADGPCTIGRAEAAFVSFPEFYATLDKLAVRK